MEDNRDKHATTLLLECELVIRFQGKWVSSKVKGACSGYWFLRYNLVIDENLKNARHVPLVEQVPLAVAEN